MTKMKRSLLMMTGFIGLHLGSISQAVLPTSWSFDTATPQGWTESLGSGNTRYTNGAVGTACRLDNTGEFVSIFYAEEGGSLSYSIKGQNTGGPWSGTFTVEQSATGANGTWTTVRNFSNTDLPSASFTPYNDVLDPNSRYVRFFFTNKVTGNNVALDEVTLSTPIAGASQEINVTSSSSNVPSGSTLVIGNTSSTDIVIQNLGNSSDLAIEDVSISGADAADFSIATFPSLVPANGEELFTLNFVPSGTGSRFCTITIDNNDASENPYTINIYGIAGDAASEPTAQAGAINFPNLQSWDFNVNFTGATPSAEHYLVLRSIGTPVTDVPSDNETYVKGNWIGNAQVVYVGDPAQFNARAIEVNTTYHYAVFSFNGPEGFENYLTTAPTTGSVTTPNANPGSYYAGLDVNSPTFVSELTSKLEPTDYFQIFYSNYISTLINEFYVKDTTTAAGIPANYVECVYSGDDQIYEAGFTFWTGATSSILSREHAFPQSWMPTYLDATFDDSWEVSDLHNLFPVNQEDCNAVRSNYPYGEVVNITSQYGPAKFGTNSFGQTCYEPRDQIKGDVARAMMYQAVKNTTATEDFSFPEQISFLIPYGQLDYVVKKWHFQDAPDNSEKARNEYIETRQNNRNGFIDNPIYACYIRFGNLTKFTPIITQSNGVLTCIDQALNYTWFKDGQEISGANSAAFTPTETGNYTVEIQQFEQCPVFQSAGAQITVGINENALLDWTMDVYPNPSNGIIGVSVNSARTSTAQFNIVSSTGARVYTEQRLMSQGVNKIEWNNLPLEAGVYVIEMIVDQSRMTKTIVVQ